MRKQTQEAGEVSQHNEGGGFVAKEYDLVILGGGIGGYVAAIRASQLGLKTAVVEADKLGGTCLHKGCIPTKTFLKSAEVFSVVQNGDAYGVTAANIALDFAKIQERKQKITAQLFGGVQQLMKQHQIDVFHGFGRILGPSIFSPTAGTISVEPPEGTETEMLVPKNILIATGSKPRTIPGLEVDEAYILTSDEALDMKDLPRSMLIVGGGVIGIEWASLLSDFGVQVTVLESEPRILPAEDEHISREMTRLLKRKKVKIMTNTAIQTDTVLKKDGHISVEVLCRDRRETVAAEKMLISVGRKPNVENIGLENTDIRLVNGAIQVNEYGVTNEAHIYAVGDVIGGWQLAHAAAHEGIIAVEHMAGAAPEPLNYAHLPRCIYSRPQAASIGLTEEEARERGFRLKIGKFPFKAVGKALIEGETDGFAKIIMDEDTDDLLGVHMIGARVTDMISEAGLAMVLDATPWEIGRTIHPHPSLSEVIGEAALAVDGLAIHV